MGKIFFRVILAGILIIFATGFAFAQPADQKIYKWNFQSHLPAGSAAYKPLKDFFEQKINKLTGGRLQITFHPAGAMVPTKDIFAVCRKGTVDGATGSPIYWMNLVPVSAIAANCPMAFKTAEECLHFHFDLGFEQMMKDAHAKHNLVYFTERAYPTAMIGKRPIYKIEDFKGYKIRSSGAIAEMLRELGAATSMIPGEELYLAMQTGVVEGAHWGAARGALTMKLPEVAKYYIQPDFAVSGTDAIIINKDAYNALPKDLQAILSKALKDRTYQRTAEYAQEEKEALDTMIKDYKVTVCTLDAASQKLMRTTAMKLWDKMAAKDADSAKAVAMLKAYLKELKYID